MKVIIAQLGDTVFANLIREWNPDVPQAQLLGGADGVLSSVQVGTGLTLQAEQLRVDQGWLDSNPTILAIQAALPPVRPSSLDYRNPLNSALIF